MEQAHRHSKFFAMQERIFKLRKKIKMSDVTYKVSKVTYKDNEFDFDAVFNLMDAEICEALSEAAVKTDQEFLDAYAKAHAAKYGEEFVIN
jgi:hypothetical protein